MPLSIIREDITRIHADAIVCTANPHPIIGSGSESAVYAVAGKERLLKERIRIGSVEPGTVFVTEGFNLPARWIIHAVYPVYQEERRRECLDYLHQCAERIFEEAERKNLRSVAMPLLGTGSNGYPREDSLHILIEESSRYLLDHDMKITIAVFDRSSFEISDRIYRGVDSYLDEHYVENAIRNEYRQERRRKPGSAPVSALFHSDISLKNYGREEAMEAASCELESMIDQLGETFQESLLNWIDRKGYTDPEVYHRANLDRKLFSKIRSNPKYHPKKNTVLALAVALNLSMDETTDLLARAGYALSPSSRSDLIVQYFITQGVYDVNEINLSLFEHDEPILA